MISLVLPLSPPTPSSRWRIRFFVRAVHEEWSRNDICEFCFRDAPRPSGPFLPSLSPCSFLCRVVRGNAEARRVSSRHDDECRNVRLEARNSIVCSFVRARASRMRQTLYSGIARKHGVYEISRLRRSPGAFVAMLSRVRWIYSRSISRDFLPVNLGPLRRRDDSRRATRSLPSSGENLHAFCRESEARGGGNLEKNSFSRERGGLQRRRLMPSLSSSRSLISYNVRYQVISRSSVESNVKGAKGR